VISAGGRRNRARTVILTIALAALAAVAGLVSTAASFTLSLATTAPVKAPSVALATPNVGVTVPTVTAQTPTVPIATPTVPIKTPTVPIKTPTVPIKTPTVPIKTPTVTVQTPPVTVKAPAPLPVPVPTVSTKTPTVATPTISTRTPTVSASAPSVTVSRGKVSVGTSSASSATPSASRSGAGSGSAPGARATGRAGTTSPSSGGPGAPGTTGSGAGAAPTLLGHYGGPRVNSGMPPMETRAGSRARARIASRERALKAIVARFQGCLGVLPNAQREVLELRVGVGTTRPLSPRAAAARMHLGVARVTRLERQAVLELRNAASTHSCGRLASFAAAVVSYFHAAFGGHTGSGGVEAVSYDLSPAAALAKLPAAPHDKGLLGSALSPIPGGAISLLLLVLFGVLALTAIVADATGRGPRHAQWRHRVRSRLRSWR
jgi:outer membrane biosynthesis protein TonB